MLLPFLLCSLLALASASSTDDKCHVQDHSTIMDCYGVNEDDLQKEAGQTISSLTLHNSTIHHLQGSTLRNFPKLETLRANAAGIERIDDDAFEGLSDLKSIDLSSNQITEFYVDLFSELKALEGVTFYGNANLTVPKDKPLLNSVNLKRLDISSCGIHEITATTLAGVPNLTHHHLGRNHLKNLPLNVFQHNRNLEVLLMNENEFTNLSPEIFTGLPIRAVNLQENPWKCDCHMTPLILWAKAHFQSRFLECAEPAIRWDDIKNPLQCPTDI